MLVARQSQRDCATTTASSALQTPRGKVYESAPTDAGGCSAGSTTGDPVRPSARRLVPCRRSNVDMTRIRPANGGFFGFGRCRRGPPTTPILARCNFRAIVRPAMQAKARIQPRPIFSGCIVNQEDGRARNSEAVGSNPTTQTTNRTSLRERLRNEY